MGFGSALANFGIGTRVFAEQGAVARKERLEDEDRVMRRADFDRITRTAGLEEERTLRQNREAQRVEEGNIGEREAIKTRLGGLEPRTVTLNENQNQLGPSGGIGGRVVSNRDVTFTPTPSRLDGLTAAADYRQGRGEIAEATKFQAEIDRIKKEGGLKLLEAYRNGAPDSELEKIFNDTGDKQVVPGTLQVDSNGTIDAIDARTGKPMGKMNLKAMLADSEIGRALAKEKSDIAYKDSETAKNALEERKVGATEKTADAAILSAQAKDGGFKAVPADTAGYLNARTGEYISIGASGQKTAKQIEHTDARVKLAIDKAIMPYFGGKFEGGAYFPDEANKDAALEAVTLAERYVGSGMEPIAAGQRAVQEVQRERAVDGAAPKTDPKFADKVKNIIGGKSKPAAQTTKTGNRKTINGVEYEMGADGNIRKAANAPAGTEPAKASFIPEANAAAAPNTSAGLEQPVNFDSEARLAKDLEPYAPPETVVMQARSGRIEKPNPERLKWNAMTLQQKLAYAKRMSRPDSRLR